MASPIGWRAAFPIIAIPRKSANQWLVSYQYAPASVILNIDDPCDVAHAHQQLSLFYAQSDERCFLPIHIYATERSLPAAVVLLSGKTPGGAEVRAHLCRLPSSPSEGVRSSAILNIGSQPRIGVVAVLITCRDHQQTKPDAARYEHCLKRREARVCS